VVVALITQLVTKRMYFKKELKYFLLDALWNERFKGNSYGILIKTNGFAFQSNGFALGSNGLKEIPTGFRLRRTVLPFNRTVLLLERTV
jgi:hypothetical protein